MVAQYFSGDDTDSGAVSKVELFYIQGKLRKTISDEAGAGCATETKDGAEYPKMRAEVRDVRSSNHDRDQGLSNIYHDAEDDGLVIVATAACWSRCDACRYPAFESVGPHGSCGVPCGRAAPWQPSAAPTPTAAPAPSEAFPTATAERSSDHEALLLPDGGWPESVRIQILARPELGFWGKHPRTGEKRGRPAEGLKDLPSGGCGDLPRTTTRRQDDPVVTAMDRAPVSKLSRRAGQQAMRHLQGDMADRWRAPDRLPPLGWAGGLISICRTYK